MPRTGAVDGQILTGCLLFRPPETPREVTHSPKISLTKISPLIILVVSIRY